MTPFMFSSTREFCTLSSRSALAVAALTLFTGCSAPPVRAPEPIPASSLSLSPLPAPLVPSIQGRVQPLFDRELSGPQELTRRGLAHAAGFPASAKTSLALQAFKDPWAGMAALEARGLAVSAAAQRGRAGLAPLLNELAAGIDRPTPKAPPTIEPPPSPAAEAVLDALALLLEAAARHREQAFQQVSLADRQFLFDRGAALVDLYVPQISVWNDRVQAEAEADRRFAGILQDQVDDAALLACAQTLLRLLEPAWVRQIASIPADRALSPPTGVTGEVLAWRETSLGLIVIGGPGRNSYDLDQRFALVIDTGGDDLYRGLIGATASPQHGLAVVIDLAGNDAYQPAVLGLAAGRLGVGLVADLAGDDAYGGSSEGASGVGFAGIGLLYDEAGNDVYLGSRFSNGAAIGGIGAVVDMQGDDVYEGIAYSLGFGGPLGVGALIDLRGNDRYSCGGAASAYNQSEAPTAKPGDADFQYDCFGLGVGAGKRIFSPQREHLFYSLAGGLGLALDLAGDDRYRSANFSQGAGYFFGAGLILDLDGQDEYAASRYGLAAGAHFGVGLSIDRQGQDRYASNGPFYTGGAAWDVSVTLAVDGGLDDDRYDFGRTTGAAIADHRAWSVLVDEGGQDRYDVPTGLGLGLNHSLAGFFDLGGQDTYGRPDEQATAARARNGALLRREPGGLFADID